MTKFTIKKTGWDKFQTLEWFGERGVSVSWRDLTFHRSGILIDYEGKPQKAIAVVIKGDTRTGEVDLYCVDSMYCELYDSIPKKEVTP